MRQNELLGHHLVHRHQLCVHRVPDGAVPHPRRHLPRQEPVGGPQGALGDLPDLLPVRDGVGLPDRTRTGDGGAPGDRDGSATTGTGCLHPVGRRREVPLGRDRTGEGVARRRHHRSGGVRHAQGPSPGLNVGPGCRGPPVAGGPTLPAERTPAREDPPMKHFGDYLHLSSYPALAVVVTTAVMYLLLVWLLHLWGARLLANPSSHTTATMVVLGAIVGRASLGLTPDLEAGALAPGAVLVIMGALGGGRRVSRDRAEGFGLGGGKRG